MIEYLFQYWLIAGIVRVIYLTLLYGYKEEPVKHGILFSGFLLGFFTLPLDFLFHLGTFIRDSIRRLS